MTLTLEGLILLGIREFFVLAMFWHRGCFSSKRGNEIPGGRSPLTVSGDYQGEEGNHQIQGACDTPTSRRRLFFFQPSIPNGMMQLTGRFCFESFSEMRNS